jgi:hypothetical protein
VYFAANLSEGQSITEVTGADAGKVTRGSEDGSTASATLEVFKVDTQALQFEGGPRDFAFTVAEDGQEDKTVTVNLTVDVESGLTGVAVFKVLSDPTPVVAYGSAGIVGDEILERLDAKQINADGSPINDEDDNQLPAVTLFDAIKWVDQNAEANTEYLIRVEGNEAMDRIILTCMRQSNVTLRLRGCGEAREISCKSDIVGVAATDLNTYANPSGTTGIHNLINTAFGNAFISVGAYNSTTTDYGSITLQLEKNTAIKGFDDPGGSSNTYYVMAVNPRHTLVMLNGSKITGFNSSNHTVIQCNAKYTNDQNAFSGNFSMYAGAEISGNKGMAGSGGPCVILFSEDRVGGFYKEAGAEIINNTDGNVVAFWKVQPGVHSWDVSDSAKTYTYVPHVSNGSMDIQ